MVSSFPHFLTRMHSSRMRTARSSSRWMGGCLPQCMLGYTTPLGVGLETPRPNPSTFPLGVGLETPPGQTPEALPWVWAWKPARHAGIHTPLETCKACWDTTFKACWDTTPPGQTDTCKNITFANFVYGR